ncbi:PRC-barrel domain containing protein [Microbacterium sp. SS28]|uniref:PRC-barrel domain containing protein n=1 Tax=Microbacterium sp. SS28 TaxID=2919948 RepID=UPI001FAADA6D|nr:PRC-barrel domain containing protein [Microbacterium sp. SS28]
MILSELLGCRVRTPSGETLGTVVDARFRRGPGGRRREGELELIALIVSPRSRSSFYGYERGQVRHPVVLAAIIRYLHRGSRLVPWECVDRIVEGEVRLGVDPPVIPLDVRLPIPGRSPGAA